jgi:cytochrome c oxidase subunit 1
VSAQAGTVDPYPAQLTRLTLIWVIVGLVLFPILSILGLVLRTLQAGYFATLPPEWFYAVMTLHGLGMVGVWFVAGLAALSFVLSTYVRPSLTVSWFALGMTLVGVVLLLAATLVGKLGVGWYFLYPLPFFSGGVWPAWATAALFSALAVFGVGWTVWAGDVLRAIATRYRLSEALGWHYLAGRTDPEVPPVVVIATVSAIGVLAALVAAVVLLVLVAVEMLGGGSPNDALLVKNLTFYFGHMLVNITMYFGVALVYAIMPAYTGRPWKTNTLVVVSWNTVLGLVMLAYLHHLYMDFAQPRWLQVLGQLSSYLSSVPAAVVTIFSTLVLVYRSQTRWSLAPMLLFLGVMGWAIGGVGAMIDSTIAVNQRFHNTMWVPAHFHTYYLMGVVLMILGAVYHVATAVTPEPENLKRTRVTAVHLGVGGYGFLLAMYLAGAESVPRRFAVYPVDLASGAFLANVSLIFILLLLGGLASYLWDTGRRCLRALQA